MADGSKIEWTEATWNPLRGCTRVSPGCGGPGPHGGCYAEGIAARFSDPGQAYHGLAKRTSQGGRWTGKVALAEHLLDMPLRWRRPRRIFVNSMSDLFHESVPDEWIDRIFAVMALSPHHTFQVLTKRSARMRRYMNDRFDTEYGSDHICEAAMDLGIPDPTDWPQDLPNVWLGVSVEDQQRADERIPDLLATPAAVRWLSCEPLLGPVNLRAVLKRDLLGKQIALDALSGEMLTGTPDLANGMHRDAWGERIDWVVAGGESGSKARPMHPDWPRALRDQCADAEVPFFFKQWGEWAPYDRGRIDSRKLVSPGSTDAPSVRCGKKLAGRLLDDQLHDAFPQVANG